MRFSFRSRPPRLHLILYVALATVALSVLVYLYLGKEQSSNLSTAFAPSKTDVAKSASVPSQERLGTILPSKPEHLDEATLPPTGAELEASAEILKTLQQDFNAIEVANTKVLYQKDNKFTQSTIILISPPESDQLGAAWDRFWQALSVAKLRDSVAGEILSKAQRMESDYSGFPNRQFKVLHGSRVKLGENARTNLGVSTYEQRPFVRITEHGSPLVTSDGGGGTLYSWDIGKKETWDRYGHLFPSMPELSSLDDPRVEKP